jgi:Lar family restriction alleviation protein
MTEELKPCPFCGSTRVSLSVSKFSSVVACNECQSEGPNIHDESEAVGKWNRRAAPSQPEGAPAPLKDGQVAALVNELRDIALKFHGAGQLRERIAQVIRPLFSKAGVAAPEKAAAADAKDAARYRWLRTQQEINDDEASNGDYGKTYPPRTMCVFHDDGEDGLEPVQCDPGELDSAIDAAMAAAPKEKP